MEKPKEWWIENAPETGSADECYVFTKDCSNDCIHVIEKSAYDALVAEYARLRHERPIQKTVLGLCDEINSLAQQINELRTANAELVEEIQELYLCFKTYNDESDVARRIIEKFAKHGGGK
jgi:hypothetical protein